MPVSPASRSFDSEAPFKLVAGDPSLDLVNTVDWTSRGLENDRLADYTALTRWAEAAGLVTPEEAEALRREAEARPREAEAAYESARYTRWVLQRLFSSTAGGELDEEALAELNLLLADALRRLGVAPMAAPRPAGPRLRWSWNGPGLSLELPLWRAVWEAARLSISDELAEVRRCAGKDCGWLFVDRSRNHLRRWCEMSTCGTRAKSRRRAARAAGSGASPRKTRG